MEETSMGPLYPEIRVSLRSRNRFALVSAIRHGLRRAGTPPAEIDRFSQEALSTQDPRGLEEICSRWVRLEAAPAPRLTSRLPIRPLSRYPVPRTGGGDHESHSHSPSGRSRGAELEDVPDPQPGEGQALVRVEAAGVNFIDVYFRTGLYKARRCRSPPGRRRRAPWPPSAPA